MKKNIIFGMLLFVASFASAQIVNIPDPALKAWLTNSNAYIDLNHDGEIDVSEAAVPYGLYFNFPVHDYTGMEAFINLTELVIGDQAGLDFKPTHAQFPRLKRLAFNGSTLPNLGYVDLRNLDSLHSMILSLPGDRNNPGMQTLNISGLAQLDTIEWGPSSIRNFIARNCTGLTTVYNAFTAYILDTLDVTGCTNLRQFQPTDTYVNSIDLSSCINLDVFDAYCVNLRDLNLKNGRMMSYINLGQGWPSLDYMNICADDFEMDSVLHMIQSHFMPGTPAPQIYINSYCTFFPVGSYNTVTGAARFDMNNNGCDNGDAGFNYMPVMITDASGQSMVRYTTNGGVYAHYCQEGNFTIEPYFSYPYFNISPTTATASFPAANSTVETRDFCITPIGVHNDLDISFIPLRPARLGGNDYQLIYRNRGNTTLSGSVQLNFDNSKVNLGSASPAANVQGAGQLTWNYSNLLPFESKTILVSLFFIPSVNSIGDTLYFFSSIDPATNDETPGDNSFILPQRIIGPYDPNDKECLQGSKLELANIGKALDYVIRFQNIGNDTAFNVVVVDTLSNKLDWNSLEITGTSHPCDIKQKNGKLEFYFKDIHLPYQAINDAGSNGFIAFKIKTKNNLVIGDSVNNKAAIYFDFNAPIITNTATTIVSPTSSTPVKLEYFSLTTKNETNLLTWKAPSTSGTTNFGIERSNDGIHFNNFGNITASVDRCQLPFNFTDEKPFDGKTYYRLNIKDADGISFYSKVLVAGKTKSGLSINAVVSNSNNTTIYLDALKAQNVQIKIIAADGRLMYNQSKAIEAGSSQVNLPLKNIATGIYSLIFYTVEGEVITKRFIK
ncbi:MAG: T9SS type A sorting domain-containing protein [Ferruginibacter sp.]